MALETRTVLAGAYRTKRGALLSHAVEVDEQGWPIRVLCRRVELDSLADVHASDPQAPPTCPVCLKRVRNM